MTSNPLKKLNIKYFFKHGSFDVGKKDILAFNPETFGENHTSYYIYKKGYCIVFFENNGNFYGQIENFSAKNLKNKTLKRLFIYDNLPMIFIEKYVKEIYGDDNERIIVLDKVMIYYYRHKRHYFLSKITPYNTPSFKLIQKVLPKITTTYQHNHFS